jgi:hypothetical protein
LSQLRTLSLSITFMLTNTVLVKGNLYVMLIVIIRK